MNWRYVVLAYFVVSVSLGLLSYVTLLEWVGKLLAFIGGVCMAALFNLAFLNMFGRPVKWD